MDKLIENWIDISICVLAAIGFIIVLSIIIGAIRSRFKKDEKDISLLYFKVFPDGTRSYRMGIKVDLASLQEGDIFKVKAVRDEPTEIDMQVYRNIKED